MVQINVRPRPNTTVIAYVASYGYHELWINGAKVGDDVLAPSVSDLAKRVLVRAYVAPFPSVIIRFYRLIMM